MNWAEFNNQVTGQATTPTKPGSAWDEYNKKFKEAGRIAEANVYNLDPALYSQLKDRTSNPAEIAKSLQPEKVSYPKVLGETALDTVGGMFKSGFQGIRASSQLAATPIAGALALGQNQVSPSTAMKESLQMAKDLIVKDQDPEKSIEEASQMWLKNRGVGKYGGKQPDIADVAALSILGAFNLFGDPAFEYGLAVRGGRAFKEALTWKKVGQVSKDLAEGTKIINPIEREFSFSPDLKVKIKPKENSIVIEGFRKRFGSELPADQMSKETQDLVLSTREATGWEMKAKFSGEDLALIPVRPIYNPQPLTPYDTPEVIRARNEKLGMKSTHLIETPERQAMREDIAKQLYGDGALNKDRRADIVIGPPAAGKSSVVVNPLQGQHGSLVIDSDMAKELIPEFGGGKYAGVVHEESDMIAKSVLDRALQNGDNLVIPIVGKSVDKLRRMLDSFQARGYEVHLHLNSLPPEKAAQRAVERFKETGRFVDPHYVMNEVGLTPEQNYATLKAEGKFNSYEHYSNDVARGEPPKLIERTEPRPRSGMERGEAAGGRELGRQGARVTRKTVRRRQTINRVADKAYKKTVKNGGVTINLKGGSPKKGYAYSPYKDSETVIPKEQFSQKDVVAFIKKFKSRLAEPGNHLGIWEDGGKVYLDVSQVGAPTPETITKAEEAGQLGVFDLGKFETIYTKLSPNYVEETSSPSLNGGEVGGTISGRSDGIAPELRGEVKTSKLSKGVEASAIEAGLTDSLGDLPEYKTINFKEQAERASTILEKDPELAKRIAQGLEIPPNGILPEAVFVAVENSARAAKDVETLRSLANSSLATEASAMGQRIGYLRERNPYSPVTAMQEVAKGRAKKVLKQKTLKQATEETVAEIKAEIKKVRPKKEDWASFIASIECK